jgi:hypothetical protein
MGSAENDVDTAHWGIALFSDKLYIFLVKALYVKKGVRYR